MKSCSRRVGAINSYTTSSIALNETSSSILVRTSHPICQRLLDQFLTRLQCRRICEDPAHYSSETTPWSALTCQRFGRLRPVATTVWLSLFKHRRQAASDQSADRSAHSKKLPLSCSELSEVRDAPRSSHPERVKSEPSNPFRVQKILILIWFPACYA